MSFIELKTEIEKIKERNRRVERIRLGKQAGCEEFL